MLSRDVLDIYIDQFIVDNTHVSKTYIYPSFSTPVLEMLNNGQRLT